MIPRRAALAVLGAAIPAAGRAATPFPCTSRPGDVAALALEGTGAPGGTVAVLGHVFRPGAIPRGMTVAARGEEGRGIPAQCDVVARHEDGSARFGVLSLAPADAITAGRRLGVILSASAPTPGRALAFDTARGAVLELAVPGGAPWHADLLAAASGTPWQSGPLAWQARASLPVPPEAVNGITSLRVVADLSLRADGTLHAEAWLRNDGAMRPGGGPVTLAARLLLDGREAWNLPSLRLPLYTGWGRPASVARDGAAPRPPRALHDADALADSGAVPRYDRSNDVPDAVLARYARALADPGWGAPLNPRGIARHMPATGGRPDIGPVTQPQAVWLATGDARPAAVAIGQAEAAGGIPWHLWDAANGSWLDLRRYPRLWTDGRGGSPPGGLLQPIPGDTGWTPDTAHGPDLSTVPLLLTGRRAFLDELRAQASWNVLSHWPSPRGAGEGNLVRGAQVRGAAWSLRTVGNAAWAAPAGDPEGPSLRAVADGNWAWLRARIPEWTRREGEAHGWVPGEYGTPGALPPWQQDYLASTVAIAAFRGSADARAVLAWMENFLAGRFLSASRGFDPHDGAAYLLAIAPERTPHAPFDTWAAIADATRARGWSNAGGWSKSDGDYAQLALQSLSFLVEVLGSARAASARAWLLGAGAPYTAPNRIAGSQFNIVPAPANRCGGPDAGRSRGPRTAR